LARYRNDPVGYARDVLGVELWAPIADALRALLEPPYVVDVDSGHNLGKTHGAAVAVNWWYDTRDPGVVITTAPTKRDVEDLLWTEVRLQRAAALLPLPDDLLPAAPYMGTGADHYAKGFTACKGESFQGRHRKNQLFVFDEKEGIDAIYFVTAKTMIRPGSGDAALRIGNPTTTTSAAYQERRRTLPDGRPACHLIRLSSLDHPNVAAGLRGEPPPVPDAVTAEQVDTWVGDWCDPVAPGDERLADLEWRGRRYRPGPIGEPRILGLRPSAGTFGVWSEALWALALRDQPPIPRTLLPVIGCDVANYGTDYTVFHVRCGPVSLYHQAVNGWDAARIAARLVELADEYAAWANARRGEPSAAPYTRKDVRIQIDDDATGRAVAPLARRQGCSVRPVNAVSAPQRPDLYARARSELWFQAARKAAVGLLNVSRLDRASRDRLERQALAPEWWPDSAGRREVESKDELRKPDRIGRSPDDMDALNLAYYESGGEGAMRAVELPPRPANERVTDRERARRAPPPTTLGRGRR
jgi:hypothetical protein